MMASQGVFDDCISLHLPSCNTLLTFIFIFGNTEIWIWALSMLRRHSVLFVLVIFLICSHIFAWGWPGLNPPIYASHVAGWQGNHHTQVYWLTWGLNNF
jgi:hypothetical protein